MSVSKIYQTVVQRYFTSYYLTDVMGKFQEDHCILQHSNRICLVTIAPTHKLMHDGEIIKVNFQTNRGKDRMDNKVRGKGKKGAQQLEANSLLCEVESSNGNRYLLRSCIQGKLIEVNEELLSNPKLLLESPENGGYIAIVLPWLKSNQTISKNLLTEEGYLEALKRRETKTDDR